MRSLKSWVLGCGTSFQKCSKVDSNFCALFKSDVVMSQTSDENLNGFLFSFFGGCPFHTTLTSLKMEKRMFGFHVARFMSIHNKGFLNRLSVFKELENNLIHSISKSLDLCLSMTRGLLDGLFMLKESEKNLMHSIILVTMFFVEPQHRVFSSLFSIL